MSNIDDNKKITKVKLSKKFVKGINDDLILPTINWDDFLENNWCYIYPNGGTAENPANITTNSRYVLDNPFPGYVVNCIAEIYHNNQWGNPSWYTFYWPNNGHYGMGIMANQLDNNKIVIVSGNYGICYIGSCSGNPLGEVQLSSAPCRVKVYKIGKAKKNG